MKKIFTTVAILVLSYTATAQNKKEQDINAIKSMCGCYEVEFNFVETFQYSDDSTYVPSKTKHDKALEWVQLVEDNDNTIVMQHLLQVGRPDKPMIIKHWRQDWEFENTNFYIFNGDNNWIYKQLPADKVKGQWSQKVFQVDDSPRYEGSATWVHVDGKSYWENRTPAPLPRREYTTRADYNLTVRGNRHEITKNGWIHDQDNDKVIREAGKADVVLAQEKGYNVYKKVDDSRCKVAQDWWVEHTKKWTLVRDKWDNVFAQNTDLTLHEKVDNKQLYKYLFSEDYTKKKKINTIIDAFIVTDADDKADKN